MATAQEHRRRAVEAVASVVAERGYHEARVADVIAEAGMSRRTFYELFSNLEECFLAAYDVVHADAMDRIPTACADTRAEWARQLEASLRDLMAYVTEHPDLARLFVVESLAAGPSGLVRHERTMRAFTRRLAASHPPAPISELRFEAGIGALHRIVHARIVDGRVDELPALVGELSAMVSGLTSGR